jgi:hypothetical protein
MSGTGPNPDKFWVKWEVVIAYTIITISTEGLQETNLVNFQVSHLQLGGNRYELVWNFKQYR